LNDINKTRGGKAIFIDIDGTLIERDKGPIKEDLEAMIEAGRKGHFLFLNTGRSFSHIPDALLKLPCIKGIAAGCGAHILLALDSAYKTIYHTWIPDDILNLIITQYSIYSNQCCLEGEKNCYIINRSSFPFTTNFFIPVNTLEEFKEKSRGDLITKITIGGHASDEECRYLASHLVVHRYPDYSEGIIKGENKAKAMRIILDHLEIRRENSIAIGDSGNDLDMIRFAGLGIAMGNAGPEIKAAANVITDNCGKGGVAEALRRFVL
jgi:Cof subfamily protein (haloacid dehalogenase superfamily)